jgi:hypothetical protein
MMHILQFANDEQPEVRKIFKALCVMYFYITCNMTILGVLFNDKRLVFSFLQNSRVGE